MAVDAKTLKRFFKERYNIPVRVRSSPGKAKWINVWIPSDHNAALKGQLVYSHRFPDELGNKCMGIVYPDSEQLRSQNWGGNIEPHSLAMFPAQWEQLLSS